MHDCTVLCVSPSEKRCDCVWPLNCTCPPIWTWKTLTILVSPGQAVFCVFYLMHAGKCSSPTGIEYLNRNAMDKKTNECLVHKEIKIQLAPSLYTYLSTPARSPSICLPHKRLKYRHWLKLQPSALKEARHTHIYAHTGSSNSSIWANLPAVSHLFVLCCTWGHLSSQTDLFRSVWITTSATVRQSLKLSWDTPLVHVCLKLCAYVWMCKAEEQTEGKGSRWLGHSVRFGNANVSLFWISSYDLWSHHWIRQPGFTVEEEIENR